MFIYRHSLPFAVGTPTPKSRNTDGEPDKLFATFMAQSRVNCTEMNTAKPQTIDEYIAGFPEDIQVLLQQMRTTISKAAPDATEAIKYAIPTFVQDGNLVHFAAFKNHIGFYPAPSGLEAFKQELSRFEGSKGAVRFPLDKPLPLALVRKITLYRLKQNREKAILKAKKK